MSTRSPAARVDAGHEEAHSDHLNHEIDKVLGALRSNGYEPALRIEDIEVHGGGGPVPTWTPPEDG